jgi:hypothetical protein
LTLLAEHVAPLEVPLWPTKRKSAQSAYLALAYGSGQRIQKLSSASFPHVLILLEDLPELGHHSAEVQAQAFLLSVRGPKLL